MINSLLVTSYKDGKELVDNMHEEVSFFIAASYIIYWAAFNLWRTRLGTDLFIMMIKLMLKPAIFYLRVHMELSFKISR